MEHNEKHMQGKKSMELNAFPVNKKKKTNPLHNQCKEMLWELQMYLTL